MFSRYLIKIRERLIMIKKTVKYKDFNGQDQEEVLYFNMTKVELTKMELAMPGRMSEYIKGVVESGDNAKLVDLFYNLILDAYGEKSEDGKRFIKNARIREEFESSAAFEQLFMDISSNPDEAELFVKGISN